MKIKSNAQRRRTVCLSFSTETISTKLYCLESFFSFFGLVTICNISIQLKVH